VFTLHTGWLGVVTGISAASTGRVLALLKYYNNNKHFTRTIATWRGKGIRAFQPMWLDFMLGLTCEKCGKKF